MANDIAPAIRVDRIGIWRVDGGNLVALSSGATKPLSLEAVLSARTALELEPVGATNEETIIPVVGMTGELRGALVIDGPVVWGDAERRLVSGFVQHLGSALDVQHLRGQLTITEARQAAVRQKMHEQGVQTLKVCPRCGRCDVEMAEKCRSDGSLLDASRLLPYCILGCYRLAALLGEGGMGSVFAAYDEKLSREVAIKVIKAELLRNPEVRFRIEREARMLARVHHPSVIALYDSGKIDDGSAFLVMELLKGRPLASLQHSYGPGSARQVAFLLT